MISSHFTDGVTEQHVEKGPSDKEFNGDLGFNVENKVFLNTFWHQLHLPVRLTFEARAKVPMVKSE